MTRPYTTPNPPSEPREIPDEKEIQALLGLIAPDVSGSVTDLTLGLVFALDEHGYQIVRGPKWHGLRDEPTGPPEPEPAVVIRDES